MFALPAEPPVAASACAAASCEVTLDADAVLALADRLTIARRFAEATPLLEGLEQAGKFPAERHFLQGFIAVEVGDTEGAIAHFRSALALRPDMTRARLELARALALAGRNQASDYHFRLAGASGALPADLARAVFNARALLRDRNRLGLDFTVGVAPDTNINNATADQTIEIDLGGARIPLDLSNDARRTSGFGLTATLAGRARQPTGESSALVAEGFVRATVYPWAASNFDDYSLNIAAGPEWRPGQGRTRISVMGQGGGRWFAGRQLQGSAGVRVLGEHVLSRSVRLNVNLDVRHVRSAVNEGLGGEQYMLRLALDRVVRQSLILTAGLTVRRDALADPALALSEAGVFLGFGGELPLGINVGASLDVARAVSDAAAPFLSDRPRREWRYGSRLSFGLRNLRVFEFSPVLIYSMQANRSSIPLFSFSRHRVEFAMSRFF